MASTNVSRGPDADATIQAPYGPLLVVLSGPSGVGKTTVTKRLVESGWPGHIVVTVTTRAPRDGEVDGVHYHFRTQQEFRALIEKDGLLEHAQVHGNWYGVPAQPVRDQLAAGEDVILTIDTQGAQTIRERSANAIFIFLAPERLSDLVMHLETRPERDTPEARTLRLLNAEREMEERWKYDYLIVNRHGHLDDAIDRLKAILMAEHSRVHPRKPRV